MTVEQALPWLKEHKDELVQSLLDESFKPSPVRRKAIPKPDGGERMLGIPTVITGWYTQVYEPVFAVTP